MRNLITSETQDLTEESARLETLPASAIVRWAHERFGDGLVLAASFQDTVLLDIAVREVPEIEVVFLDTQYHFAETLWYVEEVRKRYDLNLRVTEPPIAPDNLWQTDVDACCDARKVQPLARALEGRAAWMTGLRRVEAATRANAQVASFDASRGLVKVNPIVAWSDADVAGYVAEHDLLVHPLSAHGYSSIGCWPCTRPTAEGDEPRSGRWEGLGKAECGLHI